jgi:hypothetical protein
LDGPQITATLDVSLSTIASVHRARVQVGLAAARLGKMPTTAVRGGEVEEGQDRILRLHRQLHDRREAIGERVDDHAELRPRGGAIGLLEDRSHGGGAPSTKRHREVSALRGADGA